MIKKIISGGQTGVDRAALDAAIKLSIPYGGWIPRGRLTENGPLGPEYRLKETGTSSYAERTEKNVLEADGTLIISRGPLTGGSEYTREMAVKHHRPWLHIDLNGESAFQAATMINKWIISKKIEILNVAGPRASKDSNIYHDALDHYRERLLSWPDGARHGRYRCPGQSTVRIQRAGRQAGLHPWCRQCSD